MGRDCYPQVFDKSDAESRFWPKRVSLSCLPPVQHPSLLMLGAVLWVYRSWTRCLPSVTAFCFALLPTITSHLKFPLSFNQIFAEVLKFVRNKAPPGTQTGRIIEKLMHAASNSSPVFAPAIPTFCTSIPKSHWAHRQRRGSVVGPTCRVWKESRFKRTSTCCRSWGIALLHSWKPKTWWRH